ncbi:MULTISPECIES: TM0106 family RecB-like putative nuclease [unclassified Thiomonas]|uniref:TM0106 family RecB-like putative nuclease n=1 Tax=unclassified Thiomonas TaxID=2625466 RepID=UPI001E5C4D93|nr:MULTISPECIES: TM0106 family RecB-like putative nuclease [unclassified Thiomonas]
MVNFAACTHLTHLDLLNLDTPLPKAEDTEEMVLIQEKGFAHEGRYWELLRDQSPDAVDLSSDGESDIERDAATRRALQGGAAVVFQGTFLEGQWVGHADFLIRVERPSRLGGFSYEVADTKLARSSRAKFLIQLCLYSELLATVQGTMPGHMHVVLGDGRRETFLVDDYLRYFRRLKARFLAWVETVQRDSAPERVERCGSCRWRDLCAERWEAENHLNRVANITRTQITRLRAAGIRTAQALSELPARATVARMQPDTLQRLAQQARLQRISQERGEPVYELLPLATGRGFSRLPKPDAGDLFFDMEGDPLEDGGLEYLFGIYHFEEGQPRFRAFWAHSRDEERLALEAFMDFVVAHLRQFPRAHIYHYAPYEPSALKRLMSLHGTREAEVDALLRQHKLVDLYSVVREGMRVGENSYSIKAMERFYSSKARESDVKTAGASVVFYERWKATRDEALLTAIENYNEDDVRSTYELREWLLSLRPADAVWAMQEEGAEAQLLAPVSERAKKAAARMEDYRRRLVGDLPADRLAWTDEHRVRELLFHLLNFHRRADKPVWWALFARQDASPDELLDDLEVIAGLTCSRLPTPGPDGLPRYTYTFPEQETKLKTGDRCVLVSNLEEVFNLVVDEDGREVQFDVRLDEQLPEAGIALGTGKPIINTVIVNAIQTFVDAYLSSGQLYKAGLSFLRRETPKVAGIAAGEPLVRADETLLDGAIRTVTSLQDSYLFIQGPPGAGKTYTGSHVITELLRQGKRVAVSSNSHKAINNLLKAVEKVAKATGLTFQGIKKSTSEDSCIQGTFIVDMFSGDDIFDVLDDVTLVAGTAWLFASSKFKQKFDYLFVDEAGQVSLANLLAMSTCARNLVLLGDQMQLGQPIQGVHPGESGQSTLEYLLQGEATIASDRGIFLKETWRMHPDVCRFISDAVYAGRLEPEASTANQQLVLSGHHHTAIRPTGISFIGVNHDGCSQRSDEEAELVRQLFDELLGQRYIDCKGVSREMTIDSILVVAPYNQQVNRLRTVLPEGARVGTVDKFQGQEAEAVLVSMTTSSGEYLPRDIDFLYSKNRLNVAISRARCWVGVVASPRLLDVSVATPSQMALVNTLCWVEEYAGRTSTSA